MIGPDQVLAALMKLKNNRGEDRDNNPDPRVKAIERYMQEQGNQSRLPAFMPENIVSPNEGEPQPESFTPDVPMSPNEEDLMRDAMIQGMDREPSSDVFDTYLTPENEDAFARWKHDVAPNDSGQDYDFRGAFSTGTAPDPTTGHWPDTYKKPNHPTFSDQSMYAQDVPQQAGRWAGDTYVPNFSGTTPDDEIANALKLLNR